MELVCACSSEIHEILFSHEKTPSVDWSEIYKRWVSVARMVVLLKGSLSKAVMAHSGLRKHPVFMLAISRIASKRV